MGELGWGTPLFFDLWMAGMAGGAYFAAFLLSLFGPDEDKRLLKLAVYIGVPLVLLGVLTLVIDLGEPFRFWHLFVGLRPFKWEVVSGTGAAAARAWPPSLAFYLLSPMSMGSWIVTIFSVVGVALIALWFAEAAQSIEQLGGLVGGVARLLRPFVPLTGALTWIGFLFAILTMSYTGVVLSVSSSALWATTFLVPSLFVASATTTGVAALMAGVGLAGGQESAALMASLRKALRVLIIVQLVILVGLLVWLAAAGAAGPLVSGRLGLAFWVGAVLLGLLAPLALELWAAGSRAKATGTTLLLSSVLVLLGGLVLRGAIVIGGQI